MISNHKDSVLSSNSCHTARPPGIALCSLFRIIPSKFITFNLSKRLTFNISTYNRILVSKPIFFNHGLASHLVHCLTLLDVVDRLLSLGQLQNCLSDWSAYRYQPYRSSQPISNIVRQKPDTFVEIITLGLGCLCSLQSLWLGI